MSEPPSGLEPRTVINGFLAAIKLAAGNPNVNKTVALPVGQGHVTSVSATFTTLTKATGVTIGIIRSDNNFVVAMIANAVITRTSYSVDWIGRVAFDNIDGDKLLSFQFNRNTTNDIVNIRYTFEVDIK